MSTLALVILVFLVGYLINAFYITVLYHRGLTHRAVILKPWVEKWLSHSGSWLTGIDPKAWACMHRLHHLHSDTENDPHSPLHYGVVGTMMGQLKSYERILFRLIRQDKAYMQVVSDIHFDVNFLNRKKLWMLPYILHLGLALLFGYWSGSAAVGLAYFLGIMSHPLQGWLVNAFAHTSGYRNYNCPDNSKNNKLVAFFVFGEGYQNNHHAYPGSANFAMRTWEFDMGYWMCLGAKYLGLIEIPATQPGEIAAEAF
jgi:stearoyl-CoA desaturase (delta-9 desaturase)